MRSCALSLVLAVSIACAACARTAPQSQSRAAAIAGSGTAAKTPLLADGHPDLNGTWDNGGGVPSLVSKKLADGSVCVAGCWDAAAGGLPPGMPNNEPPAYKPQYQAKVADLNRRQVDLDPALRCKPPGVPRIGPPDKIVQTTQEVVFLYEDISGSFYRIIPTDGRPHRQDAEESYLGDAVGRWEGDTLAVETVNFNEDSWLTDNGAFHSKDLRVSEKLHRNGDAIEYQVVAEDPAVLAKPWQPPPRILKLTDVGLAETPPCIEQDLKHIVDGSHHENPR
jgi:hypothetical protein